MYDHIVAGGQPHGISPIENVIKVHFRMSLSDDITIVCICMHMSVHI
jgi:hypothetical protein